ncbi:MAG: radical SAM protein [archaeon]|nr:radical SAM protein [archaeon]
MKVKEIKVKSVLTKSKLPGADLVINPYIGCQHGCTYCYADFMKRFTGHIQENWGEFIDVKINASETINLSKISKDYLILMGSVTDPYQPLESKYQLTKKCLEKLLEAQPQIEILTKSPLILRDLELLKKFKNLRVGISIGILNQEYARQLEPLVATPQQRIDTLRQLKAAGIQTYLFMSPILPGISEISSLLNLTQKYIDEAIFENLNIRTNNRSKILDFIKKNKPELEETYRLFPKNEDYWTQIKEEIIEECEKRKIKYRLFFHHGKD